MRVRRGIRDIDHDGRRGRGIQPDQAYQGAVGEVELLRSEGDVDLLAVGRDDGERTRHRAGRLAEEVEEARDRGPDGLAARDDDLGAAFGSRDGQTGVDAHGVTAPVGV